MKKLPLFLVACIAGSLAFSNDEALKEINADGGTVVLGGSVPGILKLHGDAFSLLEDSNANIVAAAGQFGKGRIIAFSHGGFLVGKDFAGQNDYVEFIKNAINWSTKNEAQPKIAVSPGARQAINLIKAAGFNCEIIPPEKLGLEIDLYLAKGESAKELTDAGIEKIRAHIKKGGAVFVAATPWPFGKNFENFSHFPPNRIAVDFGIQFQSNGYASGKNPLIITDGADEGPILAAEALKTQVTPELIADLKRGPFLKGANLEKFAVALKSLNEAVGPVIPTKKSPVIPGKDPLVDAIVEIETALNLKLPAGKMYAIPAAQDYPGAVSDDAPRISKLIEIGAIYRGWATGRSPGGWNAEELRSTGIYAPPGGGITVQAQAEAINSGFSVVIGTYNGGFNNRKKWERYPKLQRSFSIESRETAASNGLGGLVYIRVPRSANFEKLAFKISGGVAAPLYVHGKTSVEDWIKTIRNAPAPWAEIASKRMVVTVPSDHIRDLDTPDQVAEAWIAYIEKSAELAVLDRKKFRAERIYFDRQTAAGHMHSGYPVAAHIGSDSAQAVDAKSLLEKGSWGFFHEYGHNHQHNLWMLPGTGETTCNLWSVYLFEELIGKSRDGAHGAMNPLKRRARTSTYFRNGANFKDNWSVWTALDTYLFVQEEFGWEPFQKAFAAYNAMPEKEWPKSQQEKNDEWVIQLSKATGKNLAPFWRKWNLPLTDRVNQEIGDLEVWECKALEEIIN